MNSAIDRIISVDRLAFDHRAYINSSRESPGGRGINSSCVIHSFGGKTLAVATAGGDTGERFVKKLAEWGIQTSIVPIRREIRTDLTITDKQGLTVNLNEAGPELSAQEVTRFEQTVRAALTGASWLMLCGSIPPGVPTSFYGKLVKLAQRKKVPTLVRAGGEPLRNAVSARPTMVVCNQSDAERLLDRPLLTRAQFLEAAKQVRSMGPESVILSLGSRGAVAAVADGLIEAVSPPVQAICPIGAGDALTAAYTWAMVEGGNIVEALRWGVAAGTASAQLPGMRFATLDETREIRERVEVRNADS
jgi:1-phosphofructokinase family hexose kinase